MQRFLLREKVRDSSQVAKEAEGWEEGILLYTKLVKFV